jgi:hypothetical protein
MTVYDTLCASISPLLYQLAFNLAAPRDAASAPHVHAPTPGSSCSGDASPTRYLDLSQFYHPVPRLLWNFNLGWRKADSRERRAACMGTLRRDSQRPRLPEGPPAWTTAAPRWGRAPTAIHYDAIHISQQTPFYFSVVNSSEHMAKSCLVNTKRSSGRLGLQIYSIHSSCPKLFIYQNTSLRRIGASPCLFVISTFLAPFLVLARAHVYRATHSFPAPPLPTLDLD